jgi:hypothetical protein
MTDAYNNSFPLNLTKRWSDRFSHKYNAIYNMTHKKKGKQGRMLLFFRQNKHDLIFFESAKVSFMQSLIRDQKEKDIQSIKGSFRQQGFKSERIHVARRHALLAYEMGVRYTKMWNFDENELGIEMDGESHASNGDRLDADGELLVSHTRAYDISKEVVSPSQQVVDLCNAFDTAHLMFTGLHAGESRDKSNGRNFPAFYCPFGEQNSPWLNNVMGTSRGHPYGFRHEHLNRNLGRGVKCTTKFTTFNLLMEHLKNQRCPCHHAAHAFLETMYSSDLNYTSLGRELLEYELQHQQGGVQPPAPSNQQGGVAKEGSVFGGEMVESPPEAVNREEVVANEGAAGKDGPAGVKQEGGKESPKLVQSVPHNKDETDETIDYKGRQFSRSALKKKWACEKGDGMVVKGEPSYASDEKKMRMLG